MSDKNMTLDEIRELDKKYYMNTFGERTPLCFTEGKGIELTATDGKVYKDFFAGIAVNCLGYGHKRLTKELCDQVSKLIHVSNIYYGESQAKLAETAGQSAQSGEPEKKPRAKKTAARKPAEKKSAAAKPTAKKGSAAEKTTAADKAKE